MFINHRPFGNGLWRDASCESCGKSFTVHGLMNSFSPYSSYCKECADKKAHSMIEEKIKQEIEAKGIYATVTNFSGSTFPCSSTFETTCKNVSKDEFDKIFPKKDIKGTSIEKPLTHVYIVFCGNMQKEIRGVYSSREEAEDKALKISVLLGCQGDADVRVIKKRIIGVDNG